MLRVVCVLASTPPLKLLPHHTAVLSVDTLPSLHRLLTARTVEKKGKFSSGNSGGAFRKPVLQTPGRARSHEFSADDDEVATNITLAADARFAD